MSILYQRRQPPLPGEQLLLDNNYKLWKDPRSEQSKPLPLLESEKGMRLPTWTTLISGSSLVALAAAFNHLRLKGKFY